MIILFAIAVLLTIVLLFLTFINNTRNLGIYNYVFNLRTKNAATVSESVVLLVFVVILLLVSCCIMATIAKKAQITVYLKRHDVTMILRYVGILIAILYIFAGFVYIKNSITPKYRSQKEVVAVRELMKSEKTVIHAGGFLESDGQTYTYTNCMEALQNCYNSGNRVCELDFMMTADDIPICAHDGEDVWAKGYDFKTAPDYAEFMQARCLERFTPLGIKTLTEYMNQNIDLYIVTDVKDDNWRICKYISDNYPNLVERFIIQIYQISEFDSIHALGFDNIIYTLDRTSEEDRDPYKLLEDYKKKDLLGIAFWDYWMDENSLFYILHSSTNMPIFVHTVNDKTAMDGAVKRGALLYTDNIDNDWIR